MRSSCSAASGDTPPPAARCVGARPGDRPVGRADRLRSPQDLGVVGLWRASRRRSGSWRRSASIPPQAGRRSSRARSGLVQAAGRFLGALEPGLHSDGPCPGTASTRLWRPGRLRVERGDRFPLDAPRRQRPAARGPAGDGPRAGPLALDRGRSPSHDRPTASSRAVRRRLAPSIASTSPARSPARPMPSGSPGQTPGQAPSLWSRRPIRSVVGQPCSSTTCSTGGRQAPSETTLPLQRR